MERTMRWAGYAAFAASVLALMITCTLYLDFDAAGVSEQNPMLSGALLLTEIVHWYGFMLFGIKYHDHLIFAVAVLFIVLSIFSGSFAIFSFFAPALTSSWIWDLLFFLLSLAGALGIIRVGMIVQKMQRAFGVVAFWWGITAMLSGSRMLVGDFGSFYVTLFGGFLSALFFALGGLLLLHGARISPYGRRRS